MVITDVAEGEECAWRTNPDIQMSQRRGKRKQNQRIKVLKRIRKVLKESLMWCVARAVGSSRKNERLRHFRVFYVNENYETTIGDRLDNKAT